MPLPACHDISKSSRPVRLHTVTRNAPRTVFRESFPHHSSRSVGVSNGRDPRTTRPAAERGSLPTPLVLALDAVEQANRATRHAMAWPTSPKCCERLPPPQSANPPGPTATASCYRTVTDRCSVCVLNPRLSAFAGRHSPFQAAGLPPPPGTRTRPEPGIETTQAHWPGVGQWGGMALAENAAAEFKPPGLSGRGSPHWYSWVTAADGGISHEPARSRARSTGKLICLYDDMDLHRRPVKELVHRRHTRPFRAYAGRSSPM